MPTPKARPDREITFRVTPLKYISTTAATTLMGMEQATTMVGLMSNMKMARIKMASRPPYSRFSSTESTTMSM